MRIRIVLLAGLLALGLLAGLLVAGIFQDPPDRPPANDPQLPTRPGQSSIHSGPYMDPPERP